MPKKTEMEMIRLRNAINLLKQAEAALFEGREAALASRVANLKLGLGIAISKAEHARANA